MENPVRTRLKQYLAYKCITAREFERSIGASNGYVCNVKKGFGTEKTKRINRTYSDLNLEWVLSGEGEMLIAGNVDGDVFHNQGDGAIVAGRNSVINAAPAVPAASDERLHELQIENERLRARLQESERTRKDLLSLLSKR